MKKRTEEGDPPLVGLGYRIDGRLAERFFRFCENHVPRTSNTRILEEALTEYLDRHEPKPEKKGGKK
jgi:hypothetical protein